MSRLGIHCVRPMLQRQQPLRDVSTRIGRSLRFSSSSSPLKQSSSSLLPAQAHITQWRTSSRISPTGTRSYATVSAADLQFGQPVHETHPHLLEAGELTRGITAQEYYTRRLNLAALLPENSIAILAAADLKYRSGAVFFPYRQESNFLYLTGFAEQDSLAVIRKLGPEPADHEFRLYVRPKDPKLEQWSGPWSGVQAAMDVWNADVAAPISHADANVSRLVSSASAVYADAASVGAVVSAVRGGDATTSSSASTTTSTSTPTKPLAPLVHTLRAIKSPSEIANMRAAGRISGRAITDAMRRPWTRERDLHLFLDNAFAEGGCDGSAYVPVVAGSSRGRMIHYVHNSAALDPSPSAAQTVLVDAGGEYGTYITDITRTWPLSGRFTAAQRDLYEAVLRVQRSCVALCRASAGLSLDRIHDVAENGLREQLRQLGFDGLAPAERSGSSNSYYVKRDGLLELFPHHVGHYVGLDVHDTPGYSRGVTLREGHCVTIEPGVYVPDDERWPKHFRGLAVRIEDSVCVMDDNPLNLTTEAVKEVVDIEALRDRDWDGS